MKDYEIVKTFITKEQIANRVAQLGEEISRDYSGKRLIAVGVLKGCFVFMADLCRQINNVELLTFFMQASSYGASTETSGEVKIVHDLEFDVSGEHILLIEDILDSGYTLSYIKDILIRRGAASVKICTAFDKVSGRKIDITPDYSGFEIPDGFVVGYGLDIAEKYRNLPYLGVVEKTGR